MFHETLRVILRPHGAVKWPATIDEEDTWGVEALPAKRKAREENQVPREAEGFRRRKIIRGSDQPT